MKDFSIIVPLFNEGLNVNLLYKEIILNLSKFSNYEIIFINDGSEDNTLDELNKIRLSDTKIAVINNKKNLGQSYSIINGVKISKSDVIITLDGDCQNDPIDIIELYKNYISDENIKLVGGLRLSRKDNFLKKISSYIANKIRNYFLSDGCIDTGCALKVFDKNIFLSFYQFDGLHRFLPALFKGYGHKTLFKEVSHRKRYKGISKYGTFQRAFKGIFDIIRVYKIINKKDNT